MNNIDSNKKLYRESFRHGSSKKFPLGFKYMNKDELKNGFKVKILKSDVLLPTNFVYSPSMVTRNMNQGKCGSCWAFAIAGVASDMVSIQTKGDIIVNLSSQQLLECIDTPFSGNGCDGNDINYALNRIPSKGLISEKVRPYKQINNVNITTPCIEVDEDQYRVKISKDNTYVITSNDRQESVNSMKTHIYTKGPIIGALLNVYPDIYNYDGITIYEPAKNQQSLGGHAVEIIGWGTNLQGISYWICQHDWGDDFAPNRLKGMGKGWFYVRMGVNASSIEEIAYGIDSVEIINQDKAVNDTENGAYATMQDEEFTHPIFTGGCNCNESKPISMSDLLYTSIMFFIIFTLLTEVIRWAIKKIYSYILK